MDRTPTPSDPPVLLVDDEPAWRGGQESLFSLAAAWESAGRPFALACAVGGELERRARERGWPVRPFAPGGELSPRVCRCFTRWLDEIAPGVILYNTPKPVTAGLLASRWRRRPVRHVVARRVVFPLRDHRLSRWKYRQADHFIAISAAVAAALRDSGIPPAQITVVPEGLDVAAFDAVAPAHEEFPRRAGCTFGCLAALTREKGVDVLLDALARHRRRFPDSALRVAGTGAEAEALKRQAEALGLAESVRFLGFRSDVAAVVKCLDAVVLPSRAEGFGRAALLAMAAGLPVAAAATGGIPEVVVDGVTGWLCVPDDPDALAGLLNRLAGEPERARALGAAGRARLLERFTVVQMSEQTAACIDKLLAPAGGSGDNP
ncbi:MAG TPA: glycosyltransferase [Acidobacteriota bacterium]|nr:glycosyltransferase [Acidobacteriota bacterium]HQF86841.1 glycosyltransferase [Acidobacteriota bacterium]HQG91361.1 glycosyltransferase [Acidobacteriota bacterium]